MSSIKSDISSININAIQAFSDNYIWAISNNNSVALVDPGDADVCINYIEQNKLILNSILITHHHADHTGGINQLVTYCQQKSWPLNVYGPANENIPQCDVKLTENDVVKLPDLDITFRVIDLPGHTAGHIAYFTNKEEIPLLFCGDTLFSGGCGRLFEGTAEQMLTSLHKLSSLPDQTLVYCTHEYTQANLKFALTVEPNNQALITYSEQVNELRENQLITLPTSIRLENKINPFLRSHIPEIQANAKIFDSKTKDNNLSTFTAIRRWKDQF